MTIDTPTELEAALSERYEIRQVLGRGGMATVYLADDRKHQREVAVKVLRPDLAASLGAERFLKEIQIVARLTHPHILALHDSGEAAGFLYYVMPYIDGASLRQQLERRRRLELPEALAIAAPVADALSYAHRMGIFHRDIKPENILFSQGHPIVADFGIAKALCTAGGANLTRTGFPLGTPGYMSPEQAAGMTDLDERSDVYSLAVVVYEMVTGETPGPLAHRRRGASRPVSRGAGIASRAAGRGRRPRRAGAGAGNGHPPRPANTDPVALMAELHGDAEPPRRRYREDEIEEIVKRASELEASNPTESGAMTIGGVEALAAEVGLTPELVRAAAKSVVRPDPAMPSAEPSRWRGVIGGPTNLVFERVVDGEVPESEFPVIVEEIRRVLQHVGQVSQLGCSFSWTMTYSAGMRRDVQVSVSVRAGSTRIVVRENLAPVIGAYFGGICGGLGGGGMGPVLGITIGALGLPVVAIAGIIPAWLATVYGIARRSYGRAVERRRVDFLSLADRLAALATELAAASPRRLRE